MNLFCRKYGEDNRQTIIILHGLLGISDNWVSFGKKIAESGFQVFILDLRNHGQSPHCEIFNYEAMVDDLAEFIEQNSIKNPIILGHSMGGKLAMIFALQYPKSVKKLCVIDMSLRQYQNDNQFATYFDLMQSIDFSKIKSRAEVENELLKSIDDKQILQFLMKNLQKIDKNKFEWKINLEAIKLNFNNIISGFSTENIFSNETLFIRGTLSDYILNDDITLLKKKFPNSEFIDIPNASHWVQVDQPEIFYNVFKNFV